MQNLTALPPRKPRTREAIISFLSSHFRYNTMNSWNRATSYAVKVKVGSLQLTKEQRDATYDLLDAEDPYESSGFNSILSAFDQRHSYSFQIGMSGRSSGYCVLYQGGRKDSGYKSCCRDCGQGNYRIADPEPAVCGRCNLSARYNLTNPITYAYTTPGLSLDADVDFSEWSLSALRDRLSLVWDFDSTVERACRAFLKHALSHHTVEKTIMVPKTIHVSEPR